ncbi:tyrosine-type recombinase/integrase [Mammaliicoccus sciuri]|uniref:tyrosine-type recombinase/integrase n=1 Tax=Mammaliicoccus sciuri TaxID=1296 RepID=UPI002B257522|nr:tyrosine-type recombinase/integrase [Mammaliicoccus sciuri]WQJ73428.1 tyrosine-type recombinase/integrase [Mammaliicoccus sciuri]
MNHDLKLSHNIYKDAKRGTYYFRITYYDETNTRQYITRKGFSQRKEAVKKCNEVLDELEGIGNINTLPFDELVQEYSDWYSARRKQSSYKALLTHVNNHLLPYFKKTDVYQLDTKAIMKFQNKKLKEGHSGEYLKKMHVFLVSILNHAMKYHDLKQNVASLVGNFEIESNKRLNYWTVEQFSEFVEVLPTIQQKLFFKLLFYTGARKGEIRAITWRDINFSENYIHIDKTDYHGIVTTPKTKAAIRDIYLPQHVMDDLTEYQSWYKENNIYKDDYVLFGTFFKSFSESTIDRWFTTALNVLDDNLPEGQTFPRIVIHELRHSHASHLINHGANIMIIAQRLGHADTTEVMNRYGHLYPSTQKEIVKYL